MGYKGPYVILSPIEAEKLLYLLPVTPEWEDLRKRIEATRTDMSKRARTVSEDKHDS